MVGSRLTRKTRLLHALEGRNVGGRWSILYVLSTFLLYVRAIRYLLSTKFAAWVVLLYVYSADSANMQPLGDIGGLLSAAGEPFIT